MRFWELCRTGNWPTLVGIVLYAATSCLCALAGGAIFDLPMSSLQIALLFPAPLLGGAVLLCLLLITGNDPYRANPFSSTLRASFWARQTETWWVCFLHAVTFGGFAVLTSYLTVFFHVRHGLGLVQAAAITTVVVVACCALRPVGGYLAGRFGGTQLLSIVFVGSGILLLDLAASPPLLWTTILPILVMALLSLGNGVVLQFIPQRFPGQPVVSAVGMLAGTAGGLGGCLLLIMLGCLRYWTGGFSLAFVLLAGVAFSGTLALINLLAKVPDTAVGQALEQT